MLREKDPSLFEGEEEADQTYLERIAVQGRGKARIVSVLTSSGIWPRWISGPGRSPKRVVSMLTTAGTLDSTMSVKSESLREFLHPVQMAQGIGVDHQVRSQLLTILLAPG